MDFSSSAPSENPLISNDCFNREQFPSGRQTLRGHHTLVDDPTLRYVQTAVQRFKEHMTRNCKRTVIVGTTR